MDLFKGMKGPSRPAPSVPRLGVNRYSPVTDWNDDPFGADVFEPTPNHMHKKKPPPRPPPPKLTQPDVPAKPSHFIRRPTVLSSLLSRNKHNKNTTTNSNVKGGHAVQNTLLDLKLEDTHKIFPRCEVKSTAATGALIDLSSPPSSPTLTTRSSSDGLSVDSFGSDATTSTNHQRLGGGGSASQAESGFEDDFDLFLTSRKLPKDNTLDDFASVDPFCSPPVSKLPVVVRKPAQNRECYDISNGVSSAPTPSLMGPTIIRAKPARPKPPDNAALLKTAFGGTFPVSSMNVNTSTTPIQKVCNGLAATDSLESKPVGWCESEPPRVDWDPHAEDSTSWTSRESSPPMPSVPPPPPPPAADEWPLDPADLANSLAVLQRDHTDQPYAIALYDYNTGHPDDLQFSVDDNIELVRRVDGEWLCGRVRGGAEGLFPANYVDIKIPLSGETRGARAPLGTATALYALAPVEPEDLLLRIGDTVTVLQRLSDHWYLGECNGRTGHFPANYVRMH